jgi:hypothetical protein
VGHQGLPVPYYQGYLPVPAVPRVLGHLYCRSDQYHLGYQYCPLARHRQSDPRDLVVQADLADLPDLESPYLLPVRLTPSDLEARSSRFLQWVQRYQWVRMALADPYYRWDQSDRSARYFQPDLEDPRAQYLRLGRYHRSLRPDPEVPGDLFGQ